jgi:hypothetical protein
VGGEKYNGEILDVHKWLKKEIDLLPRPSSARRTLLLKGKNHGKSGKARG